MDDIKRKIVDENSTVVVEGLPVIKLSTGLIMKQDLDKPAIEQLKQLHIRKLQIIVQMEKSEDPEEWKLLAKKITELEFQLQETWGFKKDANFHEWYMVPHCTCPKMDNSDNKGTEHIIINADCPIHA